MKRQETKRSGCYLDACGGVNLHLTLKVKITSQLTINTNSPINFVFCMAAWRGEKQEREAGRPANERHAEERCHSAL